MKCEICGYIYNWIESRNLRLPVDAIGLPELCKKCILEEELIARSEYIHTLYDCKGCIIKNMEIKESRFEMCDACSKECDRKREDYFNANS